MTLTLQIQRILLPIDDSPGTQSAIDYAALLARALHASITLIHIDVIPNSMIAIVPGATVDGELSDARIESKRMLDEVVTGLEACGVVDVETWFVQARSIASALVDAARTGHHDLVVMGTHARTGVSRLVIGSIAEEVLRHASCPVLTVHLPAES